MITADAARVIMRFAGLWSEPPRWPTLRPEDRDAAIDARLLELRGMAAAGDERAIALFDHNPQLLPRLPDVQTRQLRSNSPQAAAIAPAWKRRLDPARLLPADYRFNNSLIRFRGRLLMAYRLNWAKSSIGLAELDETFTPVANWRLPLRMGAGQEDPRLLVHRGQLHVSYSAVRNLRGTVSTDVCYARLEETAGGWIVAEERCPHYPGRDHWEKNWGFFEHAGGLHAVYWIAPQHLVLRIDGDRADLVYESPCPLDKPGFIGGGAPPVLHDGEYYCFYHSRVGRRPELHYTLDLYTFEAEPPFRPRRQIREPLLAPDPADRPLASAPLAVFPCGAMLEGGQWIISYGYYDCWCELAAWPADRIEACLEAL